MGFITFALRLRPGTPPPRPASSFSSPRERALEGITWELLAETAPPALQNHFGCYIHVLPYIKTTTTRRRERLPPPRPQPTQRSLIWAMKTKHGPQNPGCKTDLTAEMLQGGVVRAAGPTLSTSCFLCLGRGVWENRAAEGCAGGLEVGLLHPRLGGEGGGAGGGATAGSHLPLDLS